MSTDKVKVRGEIIESQALETLLKHWPYPEMKDEQRFPKGKTNVVNQPVDIYYQRQQAKPEAQPEIEEVKPLTLEELEAIRQAAYEEGLAEGKAEGYEAGFKQGEQAGFSQGEHQGIEQGLAQGLEQGQEQIAALAEQWQQLIDALQQPFRELDKQAEQELLQLSVALSEAVIHTEVKTNPEVILATLKAATDLLPLNVEVCQIQLHPEDLAIIEQHFTEQALRDRAWRLVAEPSLARGGCMLRTPHSSIDMTLKHRIKAVLDEFLQGVELQAEQCPTNAEEVNRSSPTE